MDTMICLEKVRRPDLPGLVRSRLERQLDAAVDAAGSASLGLVLAPPGSGKSTFLSHLAAHAPRPVGWYRASAEDDDEGALSRHLGYAIGAATQLPALVEAAATGRVIDLARALDDPAVPAVQLILDDLHEIAGSAAEQALERFLALRPRKVRMLLGTRRPSRLNTSRLLVSGELQQVDGDDLRFRSWEVEELFRTVYEQPLAPEVTAALTRRTGGWAAGLQLFHLATADMSRPERERAVDQLGGRSKLVRSYLARNVLAGLSAERRQFLLRTATLGVLTGDLCDALLGRSGSAAELAELEEEQFFTTSSDGGLTYRYHQVLQTHLEVLLVDELGAGAARALYSRSGELLEEADRRAAAVRAHARAEDWGSVARLLKPGLPPVAGDEALWGMFSLPGAPTDDPGLVLAGARRLIRHGLVSEAVAAYRRAEALLEDPVFSRRCAEERSAAALWLPGAAPLEPARSSSPALRWSAELRQITREVHEPGRHSDDLVRGLAQLLAGDLQAALATLRSSTPRTGSTAWAVLATRLATHLVETLAQPDLHGVGRLEEIVLTAEVEGWPWLARIGRGLQAATLLAVSPAPWRISAAAELLENLEHQRDPWSVCLTSLALGHACALIGQPASAESRLRRAEAVADELGAPVLHTWAVVLRRRLGQAASNDPAAATVERRAAALGMGSVETLLTRREPVATATRADPARASSVSARAAAPVQLLCLGGFSLAVPAGELPWQELRPRVRSLLMRLALEHGRAVHRERLVDELWPDAELPSGIRSLQVAVSAIRQCLVAGGLDGECLGRHGDAYALELPDVQDQVVTFEHLTRLAGRLAAEGRTAESLQSRLAALETYTGDLLPEVGPAEWAVDERSRLRLLAATSGAEAAREALVLGDFETGIRAARRSVQVDPYHDSSWTLLVELCTRSGDHSAAAVARRAHARVRADLGLELPLAPAPSALAAASGSPRTGSWRARP